MRKNARSGRAMLIECLSALGPAWLSGFRARYLGACPGGERVEQGAEALALARQHVLDVRRPGVAHLAPEYPRQLEFGQALRERPRRDGAERAAELREPRAAVMRGVQDRDRVT